MNSQTISISLHKIDTMTKKESVYQLVLSEAACCIGFNYKTVKEIAKKVGTTTVFVVKVLTSEGLLTLEDYQRIFKIDL